MQSYPNLRQRRALSSAGQSTTFTPWGSLVRVQQRPSSGLPDAEASGLRGALAGQVARGRPQAVAAGPERLATHTPGETKVDRARGIGVLEAAGGDVAGAGLRAPVLAGRLDAALALLAPRRRALDGEVGRCRLAADVADDGSEAAPRSCQDAGAARLGEERGGHECEAGDDVAQSGRRGDRQVGGLRRDAVPRGGDGELRARRT